MIELKCLGAAEEVTGSKYLIKYEGKNILIDCGIYQGEDALEHNRISHQHIRQEHIDGIILTHAHLDHTGYLPQVFRDGYQGSVFCTPATKDLAKIILLDNSKIISKEERDPKKDIFYTEQDVKRALAHMQTKEFHETFDLFGLKISFQIAGHILGATSVILETSDKKILFSGDLGREDDLVIQPAESVPQDISTIIMEGTYGDRNHPEENPTVLFKKLLEGNSGTILMPAFSLGRSQTLLYFLSEFFKEYPDLELPVFVDSPMTLAITEIYPEYIDQMKIDKGEIKSWREQFNFIEFPKQRTKLAENKTKKIILSASGMLSGGYILSHLAQYIDNPSTHLILSGYQSSGTLGHSILKGVSEIEINNTTYPVSCQVQQFNHFSSHQDADQLMQWLNSSTPRKIYLSHGEKNALTTLSERIKKERNLTTEILKIGTFYPLE